MVNGVLHKNGQYVMLTSHPIAFSIALPDGMLVVRTHCCECVWTNRYGFDRDEIWNHWMARNENYVREETSGDLAPTKSSR